MAQVRVMLVDDAVVVRRVLQESLSKDPGLEIVATASDGIDALEKIGAAKPDVVVLDVEMPRMDGIETLQNIKRLHRNVRVVMFSTLTSRGAEATLDALSMGADDYVTKPSNTAGLADAMARINAELVPKIKALAPQNRSTAAHAPVAQPAQNFNRFGPRTAAPAASPGSSSAAPTPVTNAPTNHTAAHNPAPAASTPTSRLGIASSHAPGSAGRPIPPLRSARVGRVDVVVIAVSTGGPNALMELIPALPADLPVPVVIVQHIPPVFSKALATRLDARSKLHVDEASDGSVVTPGNVWIAPGDLHITFARSGTGVVLHTNQGPPENSCRPAADVLFRSAADTYGANVLGVVLTGMGYDGTKGSAVLVEHGANVIAQDQQSSVVWGMPGSVTEAGLVAGVFPLNALAQEIASRVGAGIRRPSMSTSDPAGRLSPRSTHN